MKLKVGDQVKVITGKEKGKFGKIKSFVRRKNTVIVEGINIRYKHLKSKKNDNEQKIKPFEAPIHVSNVMLKEA